MNRKSTTADSWCTPKWLAELLGRFELDPCSNERSHIQSDWRCENRPKTTGDDGLTKGWEVDDDDGYRQLSVFVNPPYSNPLPWCERLRDHRGPWCALLKLDPSTRWWAALMEATPTVAPFRKRLKFEGDVAMTANFPSVLVYSAWRPSAELAQHLWLPTYARAA